MGKRNTSQKKKNKKLKDVTNDYYEAVAEEELCNATFGLHKLTTKDAPEPELIHNMPIKRPRFKRKKKFNITPLWDFKESKLGEVPGSAVSKSKSAVKSTEEQLVNVIDRLKSHALSYNPSKLDHIKWMRQLGKDEQRRIKEKRRITRQLEIARNVESKSTANTAGDEKVELEEHEKPLVEDLPSEEEQEDGDEDNNVNMEEEKKPKRRRKSRAGKTVRNPEAKMNHDLENLPAIIKQINREEKYRSELRKGRIEKRAAAKSSKIALDMPFQLPSEISGCLRRMKRERSVLPDLSRACRVASGKIRRKPLPKSKVYKKYKKMSSVDAV